MPVRQRLAEARTGRRPRADARFADGADVSVLRPQVPGRVPRRRERGDAGVVTGRLLTAREIAEQLGVSTGALLRWTRAGRVPAVKLPSGAVRYVPEQIDRWLEGQSMAGGATEEVSPAPNATRRLGGSPRAPPAPPRTPQHRTEENPPDPC